MPTYQIHLRRALLATVTVDAESEDMARQHIKTLTDNDLQWEVELPRQVVGVDVITAEAPPEPGTRIVQGQVGNGRVHWDNLRG